MNKLIDILKANRISIVLLVIIGYLLLAGSSSTRLVSRNVQSIAPTADMMMGYAPQAEMAMDARSLPIDSPAPPSTSEDRIVIRDTNMSLKVDSVSNSINKIEKIASENGGFLVSSNLSSPEGPASGSITIRVAADHLQSALDAIKSQAVKVVSEQVSGRDVTDQYEDIQAKLATLRTTQQKFEEILENADTVEDTLEVQRELINLQSQIDNLIGRQEYLEKSAQLSRITIYVSTDEYALPYTPDEPWRPEVVFKNAVRSLVESTRDIASAIIWITVYAPFWAPVVAIGWWYKRRS